MQETNITAGLMPKISQTPFYFSIILLSFVIILSLGFFVYNATLENKIDATKNLISDTKKQIEEKSKDRKVIIAKIEGSNTIRPSIDLKGIVSKFYDAAADAKVRLKGFSVVNDIITTSLIATEGDLTVHPDAASTIIKMMKDYASKDPNLKFSLEPINSITGDPKLRTTGIQFKVIPSLIK